MTFMLIITMTWLQTKDWYNHNTFCISVVLYIVNALSFHVMDMKHVKGRLMMVKLFFPHEITFNFFFLFNYSFHNYNYIYSVYSFSKTYDQSTNGFK